MSADANNDITVGSDSGAFFDSPIKAMGKVAANGNALRIQGASVVRNSRGNYTVTLNTPRSTDDYTIQVSLFENNARQTTIQIINQTTSTFRGPNLY